MRPSIQIPLFALLLSMGAAAAGEETAKESSQKPTSVNFNGREFLFRWGRTNQFEFTPASQEDLNTWGDMITLWVYPKITDGDSLAMQANQVLTNYQAAKGKIIRTVSVPRTPEKPAEHFIAAVFGNPKFLEFVEARFLLSNGQGIGIMYSHREYGYPVGPAMSAWMQQNGAEFERVLMELDPRLLLSGRK